MSMGLVCPEIKEGWMKIVMRNTSWPLEIRGRVGYAM
jgi:hypothetical protein